VPTDITNEVHLQNLVDKITERFGHIATRASFRAALYPTLALSRYGSSSRST
jgi:hypothetical protein